MAKKSLNIALGVDLAGYAKDWKDAARVTMEGGKSATSEAKKAADAIVGQIDKIGRSGTLKQASRQMENLVGMMSRFGMEGSKVFNETVKQAGKLKAELDDVKGFIEAARPDAPFRALSTTLGASAQAAAGLQGAMALFGEESEDVQKTLLKVQAAMAFSEGFKAIDGLEDGFKQLNMIIKANPFMAIASAVAIAVGALAMFTAETDKVAKATQKAAESVVAEKTEVQSLLDIVNDQNATEEERFLAKKKLIDQYPDFLGGLSAEKSTVEEINEATKNYIKLLDIKAQAQAIQELYVESLKKEQKALQTLAERTIKYGSLPALVREKMLEAHVDSFNALHKETEGYKEQNAQLQKQLLLVENVAKATGKVDAPKAVKAKKQAFTMGPRQDYSFLEGTTDIVREVSDDISDLTHNEQQLLGLNIQLAGGYEGLQQGIIKVSEGLREQNSHVNEVFLSAQQLTEFMQNQMFGAIASVSDAFGTALASGENMADALGKAVLGSMSGFLRQFGEMLIKFGLSKIAFENALKFPGGGAVAVVAGAAMIAVAASIKSKLSEGTKVAGMAQGGIIPPGFPNDSFPAMLSSNEMVIPLDRRKDMFPTPQIYPLFDGRSLRIMLRYAENDYRR